MCIHMQRDHTRTLDPVLVHVIFASPLDYRNTKITLHALKVLVIKQLSELHIYTKNAHVLRRQYVFSAAF